MALSLSRPEEISREGATKPREGDTCGCGDARAYVCADWTCRVARNDDGGLKTMLWSLGMTMKEGTKIKISGGYRGECRRYVGDRENIRTNPSSQIMLALSLRLKLASSKDCTQCRLVPIRTVMLVSVE
jgi:hypothetical protein